jgi:signal transduction histidine kinase
MLMTLRSIRWRLPISYALIALLAALALGTILITTLRDYYGQRELQFLENQAHLVSMRVAQMLEDDVPTEAIQAQFAGVSFLSQAHIRILDTSGDVIVDSGDMAEQQIVVAYARRAETLPADAPPPADDGQYLSYFYINGSGDTLRIGRAAASDATDPVAVGTLPQPPSLIVQDGQESMLSITGSVVESGPTSGTVVYGPLEGNRPDKDVFRMAGAPWGGPFNGDEWLPAVRSDKRVERPVVSASGQTLGTVEIFDGPAYGSAIVGRVTSAWAVASAVAVLLAATVGWFVSRSLSAPLLSLTSLTAHMANGDLSARAHVSQQDEIGRLAQSFNEMADRVEETVTTLRRFVGDAAHELNTPLTALNANLELAAQETDPAKQSGFVQRAREQVQRLKTLTTDLLDLSRFESNRYNDERTGVNLAALVREMSEVYASRAEQKGITFTNNLPDGDVLVQASESQLRRLVGNLLDNAIKFTPEDGQVSVGLAYRDQQVELSVHDTGIGIPQEDIPLLFGRFHRGRNTAAFPGSGLGLAIIKTIVDAHHGNVTVESGTWGTCFAVQLPAAG